MHTPQSSAAISKSFSFRHSLVGVIAGLLLAAGLVISAILLTRAYLSGAQSIAVTGSAKKQIQSDLMIWHGGYSVEARSLTDAHHALKDDARKVKQFLSSHGITNYSTSTIQIQELKTKEEQGTSGNRYRLTQTLEVQSTNADAVKQLDTDCSQLVEQGVVFTSSGIQYLYTKAAEAKIEMLAEATKDAHARAEQIAKQGGRQIDSLRSAKMGVFQITPQFENGTSWEGQNDTGSFDKTLTAVVSATFSMK
jgi:uncharacterized protein